MLTLGVVGRVYISHLSLELIIFESFKGMFIFKIIFTRPIQLVCISTSIVKQLEVIYLKTR